MYSLDSGLRATGNTTSTISAGTVVPNQTGGTQFNVASVNTERNWSTRLGPAPLRHRVIANGGGTIILAGNSNYSGGTTIIGGGTVLANNSTSSLGAGQVTVGDGCVNASSGVLAGPGLSVTAPIPGNRQRRHHHCGNGRDRHHGRYVKHGHRKLEHRRWYICRQNWGSGNDELIMSGLTNSTTSASFTIQVNGLAGNKPGSYVIAQDIGTAPLTQVLLI